MEREQTTIRLPKELKDEIQRKADEEGQSRQVTLRLQKELIDELQIMSIQTGLTVTSLLIVAIWKSVLKPKH